MIRRMGTNTQTEEPARKVNIEIARAIRAVKASRQGPKIEVIPNLPPFKYRYTCPFCTCHVVSHFWLPVNDGEDIQLCANCGQTYDAAQTRQTKYVASTNEELARAFTRAHMNEEGL